MPKKLKEELGAIVVAPDLAAYCPDLATWPTSWCGEERDVIPGEQIVAMFTPFLLDLLAQGLSRKTRNLHRDNLWLLGGEITHRAADVHRLVLWAGDLSMVDALTVQLENQTR
jgi:hypothetical protein